MNNSKVNGFWSSLRQLDGMIRPEQRRELWAVAALTVAGALAEVAAIGAVVPFLALLANGSAATADSYTSIVFGLTGAGTERERLILAAIVLSLAAVAAAVLRIMLARRTQYFANMFGHLLALEVQRRMLFQPYLWHTAQNSSRQLAAIEKVQIVATLVLLPLVRACAALVLIAAVVVVLLLLAPLPTLCAGVALGLAYFAIGRAARERLYRNSDIVDSALENRTRVVQEAAGGIREIILEGSQVKALDRFRAVDLQLARALANNSVISAVPRYLVEAAGIVVIAALALVLADREGGLIAALPVLGALALGAQRMLPLVQLLFQGWSSVAAQRAMIGEVQSLLEMPLPPKAPDAARLPFAKAIAFDDVAFNFPGRRNRAVTGLSFSIPKGSRLALLGRTGSGKSTTADLLMGLLVPDSGAISVDGARITDANRQSWRENVAHVPQLPFLADATIAENIALSSNPDMRLVRNAASLAQLAEFIAALPEGYGTRVGERAVRLSGGQRQRLAIARAIYKNAPLLVLDEATSALDDPTEIAIATALDELQRRGTTIVIIAHRSSMIAGCDLVLRLDNGRIAKAETRHSSAGG